MKKCLIALCALALMMAAVGCGNSATNQIDLDGGFSDIGEIDLEGIEVYDDVPENTIQFDIESFKLDNVDNFDEETMAEIDNYSESDLQQVAITKEKLLNELTMAFKTAGIAVVINETSGEVSLDSSVLFGGDSAVLSDEGKAFLDTFISTYTAVVFNDAYDGFISKILVEGHTAPLSDSTFESGLPLSQERAEAVKAYCLSVEADHATELAANLTAVGLSNSKPVKDADGNVDMDASRRVSFRFLINLD